MKTRYTGYTFWPVIDEDGQVSQCEEDDAHYWGVYGQNPDGTHQHIGDAMDKDSAESIVALLNWQADDPLERVLTQAGAVCNALGEKGITLQQLRPMLDKLEDDLHHYDANVVRRDV